MPRRTIAALGIATGAFLVLFSLHRDLSITLGSSEWDCVRNAFGPGTIEQTGTLRDALRPDPLYGPGYPVATWAVRAVTGREEFRAAQMVTLLASIGLLLGALGLARALRAPPDLEWIAVAGTAVTWSFANLAVQVTTDVLSATLVVAAMAPLFRPPAPRRALASGLLLGLALAVRGNVVTYAPLFALILVLAPAEPIPVAARVRLALVLLAGFAIGGAPRVLSDFLQTGRPLYHQHGVTLRAFLDGGMGNLRPDEPVTVLQAILRDPGLYARLFAGAYARYAVLLAGLAGLPILILWRQKEMRGRMLAAIILLAMIPLAASLMPMAAGRYILPLFPLVAALWATALAALPRRVAVGIAAGLLTLFAIEVALLVDKYRFDFPDGQIAAAIAACPDREPVILVRHGAPVDARVYENAIRYRLRRVPARVVFDDAPRPALVLGVPIPDTGPSVLLDRLRGRPREVHHPPRRAATDPVPTVELWTIPPE